MTKCDRVPLVSVVMPVYNREKLVADAIRSIQSQTFQDWELIILDDASTDQTVELCRSFEKQDERIHVHVNERNLGVGMTRNRLLTFAAGKYIAIQDSDDVSVRERLALELEILEQKPEIGIVSGVTAWTDSDTGRVLWHYPVGLHRREQYPQDRQQLVRFLYTGCEVANAACMFRHSLVDQVPTPYGSYRFVDDWHFFLNAAHQTFIWGIPEVLVIMNRGENHDHLSQGIASSIEAKRLIRDMYRKYKDNPLSPINYYLYRKSVSTLLTSKGRYLAGWNGLWSLFEAILWDPENKRARNSIRDFCSGSLKKTDKYSKWLQA